MGNFEEDMNIIVPVSFSDLEGRKGEMIYLHVCVFTFLQQVDAVIAASKSVTSSESFRKVLEVRRFM